MELLDMVSNNWRALTDVIVLLSALAVLWLTANFPRRKEFETSERFTRKREEELEKRLNAQDVHLEKLGGRLEKIEDRLKGIDEKLHWRLSAVENQTTILLRGHLEWEDK